MTEPQQNSPDLTQDEVDFLNRVFDLAREGEADQLAELLDRGVPVNLTDAKGDTLLILASYREQPEVVSLLIDRGADVDRVNDRGQTALVSAVFRNRQDIAERLLDAGADASLGAQTPVAVAEFFGIDDMRDFLSQRGIR